MQNLSRISIETGWYQLFSRGARDWLRHNAKVREAVVNHLPELIGSPDLITGPQQRTVQVPVHLLEHARFRLSDNRSPDGQAGQGAGQPGDVLRQSQSDSGFETGAGRGESEIKLMLELNIDDIMDWLWEEMRLPDLRPKHTARIDEHELTREGWDKHGPRAMLDRRRTIKEAIKRRSIQHNPVPFVNDDLRFHQLMQRPRPATDAVVFFALDVSASMTFSERSLAKSFFFFALQGIRRQYTKVEIRFIAHTTHAWEFSEQDFFQVSGTGGTGASAAFDLVLQLIESQFPMTNYNLYLFYGSDGENFAEDRAAATASLSKLASMLNAIGYIETAPGMLRASETEMQTICSQLEQDGAAISTDVLTRQDDVWHALRRFFTQQAERVDAS